MYKHRTFRMGGLIAPFLALVLALGACGDDGAITTSADDVTLGTDASLPLDGPEEGPLVDRDLSPDLNEASSTGICDDDAIEQVRPEGWGKESHCKGEPPDYDRLFPELGPLDGPERVHRFLITISPELYQMTMGDLNAMLSGGGPPGAGSDENPIWVPVDVELDGQVWWNVGMRYKGNSSLRSAWQSGIRKLAFRLDFDRFEDDYPEIKNQRLFGFSEMTFSNAFKDRSLIRDKLAADIFREAGVPAARGAFASVSLDYGDGPVYLGLYTMIEDPRDEMLAEQFGDDGGNLYKPDGPGATWNVYVQDSFIKKTNDNDEDWSDVEAAFEALHSDRSQDALWREKLEETFDVTAFLRCLAVNQTMVNWDAYGFMPHNYYLYGDPGQNGRLVWFPWDLNEAMLVQPEGPGALAASVLLDEIDERWPLIRFLLDDPVYRQSYMAELARAVEGAFFVDQVLERMDLYHAIVAPYAVGPEGEQAPYTFLADAQEFETSLTSGDNALKPHALARDQIVREALGR